MEDKGQHPEDEALAADFLYQLADRSVSFEEERGVQLSNLSAQLLTCISILSMVYITPAPSLFESFSVSKQFLSDSQYRLALLYLLVFIFLLLAFFFALSALSRRSGTGLASPEKQAEFVRDQMEQVRNGTEEAPTKLGMADAYCSAMNVHYQGINEKNNRMAMQLKRSMSCIGLSCLSAFAGCLLVLFHFV